MGQARKVLITAGASGIGRHIAEAFLAAGDAVCTCDIDANALKRTAADLPRVKIAVCDIGDRGQIERMVSDAAAQLGGIDVLVNNAGIAGPTAPVQDIEPADWDRVLDVNLTGAFLVTKYAIPHLIRSGQGVIIIMSSSAGRLGYPNRSPYAASKWGLIGLTKTLAMELGEHGIRANAILPGTVEGDRIERVFKARAKLSGKSVQEVKQESMADRSIKQVVDPKDVAALALYLASDAAKMISGQSFPIDGDKQRH